MVPALEESGRRESARVTMGMVDFLENTLPRSSVNTGGRILVVDDEASTLDTLRTMLIGAGFEVTCTNRLAPARQALDEGDYDLILTDLYLERGEMGIDVAELARQSKPQVPVILLTGRPSFQGARDALRSQIAEIVVKPVDCETLVDLCRRTILNTAIERRARLLEGQNEVLSSVVPRMIEAKDPTTSGHIERVVRYVDRLAQRCGVGAADRECLQLAGLLHDVGKVGIPKDILCKEGPLTRDERDVIETHPEIGYQILRPLGPEHESVRTWVYQHHERWDGRGYPNGLKGDEVALPGRILVLAEVYDALAEPRSYKPAWEVRRIIELFRAEAGKHFDPDLAHLVADGLESEGRGFFAAEATLF